MGSVRHTAQYAAGRNSYSGIRNFCGSAKVVEGIRNHNYLNNIYWYNYSILAIRTYKEVFGFYWNDFGTAAKKNLKRRTEENRNIECDYLRSQHGGPGVNARSPLPSPTGRQTACSIPTRVLPAKLFC